MSPKPEAVVVTVLLALLLGGPLAALAFVAVPADWRGPIVPAAAGLVALAVVAAARHAGRPKREETAQRGDGSGSA